MFACFMCFAWLLNFAAPVVEWLPAGLGMGLIYLALPLSLTFTLLHGSRIHREMTEARRDAFLMFASFSILFGVIIFTMIVVMSVSAFMGIARTGP